MLRLLLSCGIGLVTAIVVAIAPAFAADQAPRRIIFAQDACDPTTFNQALGPGACVRDGGVTLRMFTQELQRVQRAPLWRFIPKQVRVDTDDPILVKNIGGETHTFTEVAQFGGGVVPQLNQLAGNLTPRPECSAGPGPDNHVLRPGESFTFTEGDPGTHLYQCCIHPWMHAVLNVREERSGISEP